MSTGDQKPPQNPTEGIREFYSTDGKLLHTEFPDGTTEGNTIPTPEHKIKIPAELLQMNLEGKTITELERIKIEVGKYFLPEINEEQAAALGEMLEEIDILIAEQKIPQVVKPSTQTIKKIKIEKPTKEQKLTEADKKAISEIETEIAKPVSSYSKDELKIHLSWLRYQINLLGSRLKKFSDLKDLKRKIESRIVEVRNAQETLPGEQTPIPEAWTTEDEKTLNEILHAIVEEKEKLKQLDEIERNIPITFDAKFLEDKMRKILGAEKRIKNIRNLSVEALGEDMLILNAEIDVEKFFQKTSIKIIDARFVNQRDGIHLASYHLDATGFEDKVRKLIDNKITIINNQLKTYIAKETGRKVRKIWIEDGQLKALLN